MLVNVNLRARNPFQKVISKKKTVEQKLNDVFLESVKPVAIILQVKYSKSSEKNLKRAIKVLEQCMNRFGE